MVRLTEDVVAGHTGHPVLLTDVVAASIAGFQMLRREQRSAVSTLRCVVDASDLIGIVGGD